MPVVTELGDHEGKPVRRTSLEVRNLAGGLHKATKTDPAVIDVGERAFVLAEVIGGGHTFQPMDDGDAWERVNITSADTVTIVDEELVRELIEKQREKNIALELAEKEERDREKGVGRLDLEPPDPVEAHNRGDHKRKRKDCPECQAEVEEAQRIAAEQKANKPKRGRRGLKPVE